MQNIKINKVLVLDACITYICINIHEYLKLTDSVFNG